MEVYLNTEAFRVNSLKNIDDLGVVSLAHHHQEVDLGNKEAVKLLVSSAKWVLNSAKIIIDIETRHNGLVKKVALLQRKFL